jgi:hypothetical protein
MHLAVTIQQNKDLDELRTLITSIRRVMSSDSVTIFEAPGGVEYPYPMPVVTISGPEKDSSRLYGSEALDKLRSLAGTS